MAEKADPAMGALQPERLARLQRENPFVRISDAVYDILEEAILTSQLAPGSKLKINAIAETLGVSGTPAREAIDRLVERGLVVERVEPGKKYRSYLVFDMDDADFTRADSKLQQQAKDAADAKAAADKKAKEEKDAAEKAEKAARSDARRQITLILRNGGTVPDDLWQQSGYSAVTIAAMLRGRKG